MNTKSIVLPKKLAKRVAVAGKPVVVASHTLIANRRYRQTNPERVVTFLGTSPMGPTWALIQTDDGIEETCPFSDLGEEVVVAEPVAEPVAPIEGATVCDRDPGLSFPEWLNTIDGKSCSDPRFLPAEPARRQAEITRRLHLAWIAAKGGEG